MLTDFSAWENTLDDTQRQQLETTFKYEPDRVAAQKRFAAVASVAAYTNSDVQEVSNRFEDYYMHAFARDEQVGFGLKSGVKDINEFQQLLTERANGNKAKVGTFKSANAAAVDSALRGSSSLNDFAAWQLENEHLPEAFSDKAYEVWQKTYSDVKNELGEDGRAAASRAFRAMRTMTGVSEESDASVNEAKRDLINLRVRSPKAYDLALASVQLMAQDAGGVDKGVIQGVGENFGRSISNIIEGVFFAKPLIEMSQDVSEAMVKAGITNAENPERLAAQIRARREVENDIREISRGIIDPVKKARDGWSGWAESAAYMTASSLPYMVGVFTPGGQGQVAMAGSFTSDSYNEFRNNGWEGVSAATGAVASGVFQSAVETASEFILKIPGVAGVLNKFGVKPGSFWATQFFLRTVARSGIEVGEEIIQEATTPFVQELANAIIPSIPDTPEGKHLSDVMGKFFEADNFAPLILSVLPLGMIGAGMSTSQDMDYLKEVQSFFGDDAASEIMAEADPAKRDAMIREKFKAMPVEELVKRARMKMEAMAKRTGQSFQNEQDVESFQDTTSPEYTVSVTRTPSGWQVRMGDGNVIQVDSVEAARRIAVDLRQVGSQQEADKLVGVIDGYYEKGRQAETVLTGEKVEASEEFGVVAIRRDASGAIISQRQLGPQALETVRAEAEVAGIKTGTRGIFAHINGSNEVFPMRVADGAKEIVRRMNLYKSQVEGQPQVITFLHENFESTWSLGMANGTFSDQETRTAMRALLPAFEGVTALNAEEAQFIDNLRTLANGQGNETMLRETVSEMVIRDVLGRDRQGRATGMKPGSISRAIEASVMGANTQEEVSALKSILAAIKAFTAYLKGVFGTVDAITKARDEGKLGEEYDTFINKVLGIDEVKQMEGQAIDEAKAIMEEMLAPWEVQAVIDASNMDPTSDAEALKTKEFSQAEIDAKEKIGEGSESEVFDDGDNVLKVAESYNQTETLAERVVYALRGEKLLGNLSGLRYAGFRRGRNGVLNPVFSQRKIEGPSATKEQVRELFAKYGWSENNDGSFFIDTPEGRVTTMRDLYEGGNVIDVNGQAIPRDIGTTIDAKMPFSISPITSAEDVSYNEAIRVQPTSIMARAANRDSIGVKDNILYRKDRAYRFIGAEGLADLRESGLVRARQNTKQAYERAVFMSGKSSGRYADTHMIEVIPDDTWSGDKYISPSSDLAINDIPHRIYERNADGSYSVIEDTIGDQALLNESGLEENGQKVDAGNMAFSVSSGGLSEAEAPAWPYDGKTDWTGKSVPEEVVIYRANTFDRGTFWSSSSSFVSAFSKSHDNAPIRTSKVRFNKVLDLTGVGSNPVDFIKRLEVQGINPDEPIKFDPRSPAESARQMSHYLTEDDPDRIFEIVDRAGPHWNRQGWQAVKFYETYDGNPGRTYHVLPEFFNPESSRAAGGTFSISPIRNLNELSDQVERNFAENPAGALEVKSKVIRQFAKLRDKWSNERWTPQGNKIRPISEKRTVKSLDKEQAMRQAQREVELVNEGMDKLTPDTLMAYSEGVGTLEDDPLVKKMLHDNGRLMSKATAAREGRDIKDQYDDLNWIPPQWYSNGRTIKTVVITRKDGSSESFPSAKVPAEIKAAIKSGEVKVKINKVTIPAVGGIMPDVMANNLGFDTASEMWAALESSIKSHRNAKADYAKAEAAVKAVEKAAFEQARQEAQAWRDEADAMQKEDWSPRESLVRDLITLEAIVAMFPQEIRGKIGGFVTLARKASEAARLKVLQRQLERGQVLLEKHLKEQYGTAVDKLFDKYRPERKAGEKPKGKLDPDAQEIADKAESAMGMTADEVNAEIDKINTLLNADNISAETETKLEAMRELVQLLGDWKNANSARRESAFLALNDVLSEGWAKWKMKQLLKREQREEMRKILKSATGKKGVASERDKMKLESAKVLGKASRWVLNLSSFGEVMKAVFGEKAARQFIDNERNASNQYEDAIQLFSERIDEFFTTLAGGVLKGERLRFDLAQPTLTIDAGGMNERNISQLQGIQALLMWQQEDGKRHMEGPRDENGAPIEGKWSYDQAWIDELTSKLSPEAVEVKKFIEQLYGEEWVPLNAVYRERHGVNLPRHDKYAPITVTPQQAKAGEMVDPVSGAAIAGSILTPGSLRSRNRSALAEPEFRDALSTFIAHTKQMEHWKAYYDLAVEMQAVLGNRDVANSVKAAVGDEGATVLRKWVDVFAQGGTRDAAAGLAVSDGLGRLAGRVATVGLLGRFSTLLVQSTQLAAASVKMPTGAYLKRFALLMSGNLQWADAINSEFIQRRIKSAPPIIRQAFQSLGEATRPNEIQRVTRFFGQLLSGADGLFTAGTYAILLDYHRTQGAKMGMQGEALESYAHAEAVNATEQVAQPVRTGTRSIIEVTNTNPLAKMSWAYASEARQKMALFAWSAYNAKNDPAGAAKTAFLVFVIGGLMSQVLKNLWREAKGDDDEKKWSPERLTLAMLSPITSAIPGASMLAGEGGSLSGAEYTKYAIKDVFDGDADMKDVDTILSAMGYFNDTAGGIATLSHAGYDFAKLLENAFSEK